MESDYKGLAKSKSFAINEDSLEGKREPGILSTSSKQGISTGEHYGGKVESQHYSVANFKINDGDLPVTKEAVKRRRPTTAPRSRVQNALGVAISHNPTSTSRKQLNLSMYNSSENKVKTYLKREVVSNKFLSINDYKAMTKQVHDLNQLE